MLVIEVLLKLKSKQGDIIATFFMVNFKKVKKYLSIFRKDLISMTNVEI